jgi:hypothetical protein
VDGGRSLSAPQLCESSKALVSTAQFSAAPNNVGEVAMHPSFVAAPRGLLDADREAFDVVCGVEDLFMYELTGVEGRVSGRLRNLRTLSLNGACEPRPGSL